MSSNGIDTHRGRTQTLHGRHGVHLSRCSNGNDVSVLVEELVRHRIVVLTFGVLVEVQPQQALERHGLPRYRIDLVLAKIWNDVPARERERACVCEPSVVS